MSNKNRTVIFRISVMVLVCIFIVGVVLVVRARIPEDGIKSPVRQGIQTDQLKEIINSYE